MSKVHPFLSLTATVALLAVAGVVRVRAFPLRAPTQAASPGSQPAEKEILTEVDSVIPPTKLVRPAYPPAAKKAGIEGKVRLRVTIYKDGSVMDINVLSGPPQLVKASLEAVEQWRYSPSKEVRITIVTITFALPRGGAPARHRPPA